MGDGSFNSAADRGRRAGEFIDKSPGQMGPRIDYGPKKVPRWARRKKKGPGTLELNQCMRWMDQINGCMGISSNGRYQEYNTMQAIPKFKIENAQNQDLGSKSCYCSAVDDDSHEISYGVRVSAKLSLCLHS